jgi:[protein-PII] uridylyltransferase
MKGNFPEEAKDLRAYLTKRFGEIRTRHLQGATGGQIVASVTDLADEVIEGIYRQELLSVPMDIRWRLEDGLAFVALGGYGRGELSPYSDIDLMFLHRQTVASEARGPAARILQRLWDAGYKVGHSHRTIRDCVSLAKQDLTVRTALMEARFLAGSEGLFDAFRNRFSRSVVQRNPAAYIRAKIASRLRELSEYGATVHLLEPNVKMSRGGLRDLHLLRWAALTRYRSVSFETLKNHGIMSPREFGVLSEAQEFLWRVRNEMHFAAGRAQDQLTFGEQIRLAEFWGFKDRDHLMAVEQFMKMYYEQTTSVTDITHHLVDQMIPRPLISRIDGLLRRRSHGGGFRVAGDELFIEARRRGEVFARTSNWLKLFALMPKLGARLSYETHSLIKKARDTGSIDTGIDNEAARVFMGLLGSPGRVVPALRQMHRLRLLEVLIPEFATARGLMQFNEYHKYTVDEHCLRAVEEGEAFMEASGPVGKAFRDIQRKDLLRLALLIHDLGKGHGGNHSAIGVEIAERLVRRLGLDSDSARILKFLVEKHLIMTHLAFRRDLSDETVLISFAKAVSTPEILNKLYVLTLADVSAVGPGTLNEWKKDLLAELYSNTLEILTGEKAVLSESDKAEQVTAKVLSIADPQDRDWMAEKATVMTPRYLMITPPFRILKDLEKIRRIPEESVLVDAEYDPVKKTTEYTVYTTEGSTEGIFYKIAGVLASRGLQILGATIATWKDDTVVDVFRVRDEDFSGAPTQRKMEKVSDAIREVLTGRARVEEMLAHGWRIQTEERAVPVTEPTQVAVDNASSERYTILDVFARDRQGLLFIIARAMFDLGLSVHTAKVATALDQIVDAFYVTDRSGKKIVEPEALDKIRKRLVREIEQFLEEARGRPSFKGLGEEGRDTN